MVTVIWIVWKSGPTYTKIGSPHCLGVWYAMLMPCGNYWACVMVHMYRFILWWNERFYWRHLFELRFYVSSSCITSCHILLDSWHFVTIYFYSLWLHVFLFFYLPFTYVILIYVFYCAIFTCKLCANKDIYKISIYRSAIISQPTINHNGSKRSCEQKVAETVQSSNRMEFLLHLVL